MDDVAARLVVSTRCLYDILAELNHRHPDTAWFRKVGRFRRFTQGDYRQLVEALKWRARSSGAATSLVGQPNRPRGLSLKGVRTRETKRMHEDTPLPLPESDDDQE